MKLYLIGGLSVLSFVLGALVVGGVLRAEDPSLVGGQYVLVGAVLGVLFLSLGGLSVLGVRTGSTPESSGGVESHESDEMNRADRGADVSHGEPIEPMSDLAPVSTGPAPVVRFPQHGPEPAIGHDLASQVMAAVSQHEEKLIDRLLDEGLLTTEGPITQGDVRAMVWVAVSSIELTDSLLTALSGPAEVEIPDLRRARELSSGE